MKRKYYLIFLALLLLGGLITKAKAQECVVFEYDNTGNRILKAVADNCDKARDQMETQEIELQEDVSQEDEIAIYPNPTDGDFKIVMPTYDSQMSPSYILYDLNGVIKQNGNINGGETEVDIGDLAAGVYFLRIVNGDDAVSKIVLKQ